MEGRFKEKGDIQDCGNYRGIKITYHTMKIWERINERRLREECACVCACACVFLYLCDIHIFIYNINIYI